MSPKGTSAQLAGSGHPGISIRMDISISIISISSLGIFDGVRGCGLYLLNHWATGVMLQVSCEIFLNVPGTSGSPDKLLWLQLPAVSTVPV